MKKNKKYLIFLVIALLGGIWLDFNGISVTGVFLLIIGLFGAVFSILPKIK